MNLVARAYPHRRALFVLLCLLLAAGGGAAIRSARSIYPRIAFPRIAIIAEAHESPVRALVVELTQPIEQAVSTVPGIVRVRSKTVRGASELNLDFEGSTDMVEALALVRARVEELKLPESIDLTIERQTPALFPVISFSVIPGADTQRIPLERARLAEWTRLELEPRLARLEDAFFVTVQSGDLREWVFEADPARLAAAGVDGTAIVGAIAGAGVSEAVARAPRDGLQVQVLVDGRFTDARRVLEVAVPRGELPPILLSDLGSIEEAVADRTVVVTGGGADGVVVSVFLRDGGKVTALSEGVRTILEEIEPRLPAGARIEPVYDQAVLVDESIRGVFEAIALGALLASAVLLFFLGDLRVAIVAGLAIPISVLITLATFPITGESLNLMSLGGLAIAIGLIIDDAIVVVESVARKIAALAPDGRSAHAVFAAIAEGTREVTGAVIGSSLTTVVVFVPLAFLEGVVGQFFKSLALALGISVVASLFVALLWAPLLLLLPALRPRAGARRFIEALQSSIARGVARLLAAPGTLLAALALVLLLGALPLKRLATGFLPEMDEGGFVLDYQLPVGTSLDETDKACRRIENELRATAEIQSFSRRTGAELGFFATEQFTGDFLVGLTPRDRRTRDVFEVLDDLRERLDAHVPQAEVEFVQVMADTINDLAGNPDPIEVKLFGPDYPPMQRAADRIAAEIEEVAGVVDVENHVSFGSPEERWEVDSPAAARLGLTAADVARQLRLQSLGEVATKVQEGNRLVDLRVRYPPRWRLDGGAGHAAFLAPSRPGCSTPVPLASVAKATRVDAENELERENQLPMVRVTAGVSGRDLGSVARAVAERARRIASEAGLRVEVGGQVASQARAFENLLLVFGSAALLTFLLLVVQFRSLRLATVLFLALPFGQVGALLALELTGAQLNVSSGMGLILLVGLVVKNGIILIEYAQRLRRDGRSEHDAIVEAVRVRCRPILMTTLASIAGLVPLALGIGAGAALMRPLAIAVIGGLSVSTLFTLLVVPAGCALLASSHLVPDESASN